MSINAKGLIALGLVSTVLAAGLPALAQKGAKRVPKITNVAPIKIYPKQAATIDRYGHIGKWYDLQQPQQGIQDAPPWYVAFDCFEEDPVTLALTNNLYGATYTYGTGFQPGSRFWFGAPYLAPYVANDMRVAAGWAGLPLNRFRSGFSWGGVLTGSEQCYLIMRTYDTFGFTPAGTGPNTANSNFLTGVVLNFDVLPYTDAWYTFDTGALPPQLSLKMPNSGTGGYEIVMANSVTPNVTLATHSQFMLWCTKPLNPSYQGLEQWYDDTEPTLFTNVPNGILQTNPPNTGAAVEWNDFTFATVFPVPLGTLCGFYCDYQPLDSYDITGGFLAGPPANYPTTNLYLSDNAYIEIIGDPTSPAPQIVVHHTTTYVGTGALDQATSKIDVITETNCSRTDMAERLQGYDWTLNAGAGGWSGPGSGGQFTHPTFATDTTHTDTINTTPARYVNPTTREVKMRYTWIPASDVAASDGWLASMDRCNIIPTR